MRVVRGIVARTLVDAHWKISQIQLVFSVGFLPPK